MRVQSHGHLPGTYLVVIVKVDPASQTLNGLAPLCSKSHDDSLALLIVLLNSNLLDRLQTRHAELLIDLVLDGDTVGIPAKASLDIVSLHCPVSRDDVLDRGSQQVAIVRKTGCEGRPIVKGVGLTALGELNLAVEGVNFPPPLEDELLLGGKIDRHGGCLENFSRGSTRDRQK